MSEGDTQLKMLSDIVGKVGKLEAYQEANIRSIGEMASSVNRLVDKLDKSDDIAREADQSARSAHHRLNKIDKVIFWAGTVIIGSLVIGAVGLLFKFKGA